MTNLSEVAEALQHALTESKKAEEALESAKAKLEPLEESAREKRHAVQVLMNQYAGLTGEAPSGRGRRGSTGPRKSYNISPESKIAASGKRAFTRAKNAGLSDAEAKKAQKDAEKTLAAKLGVK